MVLTSSTADAAAVAVLGNLVHPDRLNTAAGLRHWQETMPEPARLRTWKVERNGSLVGWASASLEPYATGAGRAECAVMVHPDHRGRGFGSALWAEVAAHLAGIGGIHVITSSRDDAVSMRFCEHRGFRLTSTSEMLALDPRSLPDPPPVPPGIEIRSCVGYEDDPAPLYAVDFASAQDEPGEHDYSGLSYELWRQMTFEDPNFDREASQAILVDGEVVGLSLLYADHETGRAVNGGTGVLAGRRGRGLATLLKRHVLARAAAAGVSRVMTENDETNEPMLAINRKLGYTPMATRHGWTLG